MLPYFWNFSFVYSLHGTCTLWLPVSPVLQNWSFKNKLSTYVSVPTWQLQNWHFWPLLCLNSWVSGIHDSIPTHTFPTSQHFSDGDELCDWAMSGQNNLMSLCYNAWLFIGTVSFLKTEVLLQAPEKCHKVLVVMQCPVFVAYWLISIAGNQSAGLHLKQLNSWCLSLHSYFCWQVRVVWT